MIRCMETIDLEGQFHLSYTDAMQILEAMGEKTPIIIDSNRNVPTGKTTLRKYLRDRGVNAFEAWELEERKPNTAVNRVCCYIWLGEPVTCQTP